MLDTDARNWQVRTELFQAESNGDRNLIGYLFRSLHYHEKYYSKGDKEYFAVV